MYLVSQWISMSCQYFYMAVCILQATTATLSEHLNNFYPLLCTHLFPVVNQSRCHRMWSMAADKSEELRWLFRVKFLIHLHARRQAHFLDGRPNHIYVRIYLYILPAVYIYIYIPNHIYIYGDGARCYNGYCASCCVCERALGTSSD